MIKITQSCILSLATFTRNKQMKKHDCILVNDRDKSYIEDTVVNIEIIDNFYVNI